MASISQVSICNSALAQLGASPINSLSQGTTTSTLCNTFFDLARTKTLNLHTWNFSVARIELAPDAKKPLYEFEYQFTLPADYIRFLDSYQSDWRLEGRKILSNSSTCYIKYVRDVEDVSSWSAGFVDTMIAQLRLDLSYPLTKNPVEQSAAMQNYEMVLRRSKYLDASEDITDNLFQQTSPLLAVRY
jgi:hypothetical protein